MVKFVRKFIPTLASIQAPLLALTKNEAVIEVAKRWGPITIKRTLQFPDISTDFVMHVDASKQAQEHYSPRSKVKT